MKKLSLVLILSLVCFFGMTSYAQAYNEAVITVERAEGCDGGSCPLPPDGDDGENGGCCPGEKLSDGCDGGSCPLPPDGDDGENGGCCPGEKLSDDCDGGSCPLPPDDGGNDHDCGGCHGDK